MKTIKIIDLLNKIANDEKVPKKIKIGDKIYNLNTEHYLTYNIEDTIEELNWDYYIKNNKLNDEIEIIDKLNESEVN